MALNRDQLLATHKDYKENVNHWEYFIRSYNGGFDYQVGQYLNRYNLELDNEFAIIIAETLYKFIHLFFLELSQQENLEKCKMKLV